MNRARQNAVMLDAKAETGWGTAFLNEDYRHTKLSFGTANNGNLTVKIYGSIETYEPIWTDPSAVGNQYDTIQLIKDNDGFPVNGDIGMTLDVPGTDQVILYSLNIDGLKWINARVTDRSAGSVTLLVKAFN